MKFNKIKFVGLSLILLVAVAGCRPTNTNLRNLGTQTRLNDNMNNDLLGNTPLNTRDRLNTNLNTGLNNDFNTGTNSGTNTGNDTGLNNNLDTGLNNGMNNGLNNNLNDNLNNGMVRNEPHVNPGMQTTGQTGLGESFTRMKGIADKVMELPEVNDATVLVHGDKAIVGCSLNGNTTNTIGTNLRNKVEAQVKNADRNVKTVAVWEINDLFRNIASPTR